MTGLRERKKVATRQHIADVAARLFAAHGFEDVTVDQVAQAADVAKKTVFNYFPTKEDLVYDRAEAREQDMVALVRERPPGVPVIAAFRGRMLEFLTDLAGREPGFQHGSVFELVKTSPALQRKGLELRERQARVLAAELATVSGAPEWDPLANTVARALLAAHSSVFMEVHRQLTLGATPHEAAEHGRQAMSTVFDQLEQGFAHYPSDSRPDAFQ
jgi:AcrR family transcriptional regulator